MILYHSKFGTELEEYGIDLPLRDDRSQRVFELLLKQFPKLSKTSLEEVSRLCLEDFSGIHEQEFLKKMADDSTFLEEILKTYECNSEPKRYFPERAKKPLSELRESILWQVSATFHGLKMALDQKFCFFLGGGMHHGYSDHGSGFCPLNDIVISLKLAQKQGLIKNALVIDTDAHYGDGTAEMTSGDDSIKTLSIHMADSWPLGEKKLCSSDLDIPIKESEQENYLVKLSAGLETFTHENFDVVIVVAGADPHCDDELLSTQKLKLSSSQMLARDMTVYKWCEQKGIAQLWLMAGGYGKSAPQVYSQFILKVLHLMG